jgi:hypothetical protein
MGWFAPRPILKDLNVTSLRQPGCDNAFVKPIG